MAGKKVVIWVDEHHSEVEAFGSVDVFEAIKELLMDIPGAVGELVPDDDPQWGGYRRIVVHISPPIRRKKYLVELHRRVTQVGYVEVEAESVDEAQAKGHAKGFTAPPLWEEIHNKPDDISVFSAEEEGQ
jgi:hypothetical protein